MISFDQIPSHFASEFELNNAIAAWVTSLPEGTKLTQEQKDFVMQYTGKGQEFKKDDSLVSEGLYEFYTPNYLRELMWQLAYAHGYDGGPVLEPSCATGHFFLNAPNEANCTGIELNPVTAKIAQLVFPKATIHNMFFEQVFMDPERGRYNRVMKGKKISWLNYPFSLVIGNPPYGTHKNLYSKYFSNHIQVEIFFLIKSLQLLKPGGVLVFLTASSWLRNGDAYNHLKMEATQIATLVDAYRMPTVFKRSGVPTDILVYKKN